MKYFYLLLCLCITLNAYTQPPVITYNTPQIYNRGTAIVPIGPINTGGSVPAGVYGFTSTFSGTNRTGFTNGTVTTATYYQPRDVTVDLSGNVYIVDDNNVIRKVTPEGVVTTFAGSGALGSADGTGTAATFRNMLGIITDKAGNIYVTDSNNNMIRKITPAGVVTTLAGNGLRGAANGPGPTASFNSPFGICIDATDNLYVADMFNGMIRKITPAGMVSTVAGGATGFIQPEDVTVDGAGNLYVADAGNNRIQKITPAGFVSTLAGSGQKGMADGTGAAATFNFPTAITIDAAGNLFVADSFNQIIRKVTQAGVVTTIAGSTDGSYGYADGIGRAAKFSYPYGIGTDGGNLYIADNQNEDIRKISLTGYTISAALPAGLVFDPATGIISGTPAVTSPSTNYIITAYNAFGSSSTTINITVTAALPQIITFNQPQSKTYGDADFNSNATSSNTTLPLLYNSSNPAVATITPAGLIHIVGAGSSIITVTQNGDATYAAANPVMQTLTVNPAILTITADSKTKTYGAANPAFTFTYNGFVLGETIAVLKQLPAGTTAATTASGTGVYTINTLGAGANNYAINYIAGILNILPATLIIKADDQIRQYGQPNPVLTVSYNGFVNGDTFTNLTTQPVLYTMATISSAPATYDIVVNNAQASNYNITYTTGKLTVTKAVQTITFNTLPAKTIGDPDFLLNASSSAQLAITYNTSNPAIAVIINGNQLKMLKAGTVTIIASQPGDSNYEAASAQQILNVYPIAISVPNAFTPNHDGINDTWNISGLETDPDALVSIYNRYGNLIFQSRGYSNPWNGQYQGTALPFGTYFYIISAKNNTQKLSGAVTIIY